MKKLSIIISISFFAFLTIRCGNGTESHTPDYDAPIKVTVSIAGSKNNSSFFSASGKIRSENTADLSTRMMGYVNSIDVKVGDNVTKGQILLTINNADLLAKRAQVNASIAKAKAAFNVAEKDYYRFKNLFEVNSATQKEMDDVTSNFEIAKADLEASKELKNEIEAQFAYSNIRAPFNGVITNRHIEVGGMANPGFPLISIESPGTFEVVASIPESEISNVKSDQIVSVSVKSINKVLSGTVTEVSSSSRNTGGQYLVKIRLNETESSLLSGMFVSVNFPIENIKNDSSLILISKDAIIQKGQLSGVYTIKDNNTAILRWLRLGRPYGDRIEVLSGLNLDEEYIVTADGKLYNGAKVTIQNN